MPPEKARQILKELVKRELLFQNRLEEPYWSYEREDFSEENVRKMGNRHLAELFESFSRYMHAYETEAEYVGTEERRHRDRMARHELAEPFKKESEALIKGAEEEFLESEPPAGWVQDLERASGLKRTYIKQPVVLIDNRPVPATTKAELLKNAAVGELLEAAKKVMFKEKFAINAESASLISQFLAQFEEPYNFEASIDAFKMHDKILKVEGTALILGEVNKNGWQVPEDEAEAVIEGLKRAFITCDHSHKVRDNVGAIEKVWREGRAIKFSGYIDDSDVIRKVKRGHIKYVSIGAKGEAVCSKCGKPTRPKKTCECEGAHEIVKRIKVSELSLVTEPAYTDTKIERFEEAEED